MSLWDWIYEFRYIAHHRNDNDRIRLATIFDEAYKSWETDPDHAFALIMEGRDLAKMLSEEWWVLFYEHWRLQWLLYCKPDYREILDLAVKAALEARKPQYADLPQRICLQEDLIAAYLEIDPVGYAEKIEQALDYVDKEIVPGTQCQLCVANRRTTFELDKGNLKAARDCGLQAVSFAESNFFSHHAAGAYSSLCNIAYLEEDFDSLAEWAEAGEELSRHAERKSLIAEFLLWKALLARRSGEDDQAGRLHRQATTRISRLLKPPEESYLDVLAYYHEMGGRLGHALRVREKELEQIQGKGMVAYECQVHIKKCRLLKQLGRLQPEDLREARHRAKMLKKPQRYLDEIDLIEE